MTHVPSTVLFVNPPGPDRLYRSSICTFISKARYIWQPQDFVVLSAHIPKSHNLVFIDCSINNMKTDEAIRCIKDERPGFMVVALSSITFREDLEFLRTLKASLPDVRCLVLGDVLLERIFWNDCLQYADGLILNSMDIDLAEYITSGKTRSKNLVLKGNIPAEANSNIIDKTPTKVSIGIPRHGIFLDNRYRFPFVKSFLYSTVSTQFGCPFRCAYCSACKIPVTYRGHEEILEELELLKSLEVGDLFFSDPTFGFPKENAKAILSGMVEKKLKLRWCAYANPIILDDESLRLMKRAGCHTLIIGIDDEDLGFLKDRYKRDLSKEKLIEFCKVAKKLGIDICADFIIGLSSDKDAVDRMVGFAKKLDIDYASFNLYTPLLGSETRRELVAEGKLDPRALGWDTSGVAGDRDDELIKLKNKAVRAFYFRPMYILKRIMKLRSFEELFMKAEEMFAIFMKTK